MRYLILLVLGLISFNIQAQNNPNWLRHQSISPDGSTIIFTYKGDLYSVPSKGGDATQLTFHKAHDGLKKINLNNGAGDPAIQRDKLCYDIMNRAGIDAPRSLSLIHI